tara:strand:+ start:784 stop:1530 length:747 start_codon:yes stop_codon:yes gene_type:complete
LDEFVQFVRKTPTLLSVAFTIQSKLQAEICGTKFWTKVNTHRRNQGQIGNIKVNMNDIDEVVHAFEDQFPNLLSPKKKKKDLGYTKKRNSDGTRNTDSSTSNLKKKGKGGKYGLKMQLPDGDFNVQTSKYEEREQETRRPPRPKKYDKLTRKRERRKSSAAITPNGKLYPKKGKLRVLKRHNSAKKLQAAYRGTVARKNDQKAQERRKRIAMKSRQEGSTVKGKKRKRKLARKKSLQSPKGSSTSQFF